MDTYRKKRKSAGMYMNRFIMTGFGILGCAIIVLVKVEFENAAPRRRVVFRAGVTQIYWQKERTKCRRREGGNGSRSSNFKGGSLLGRSAVRCEKNELVSRANVFRSSVLFVHKAPLKIRRIIALLWNRSVGSRCVKKS